MAENTKIIISAVDKTKKGFGSVGRALGGLTKSLFSMRTALIGVAGVAGFGLLIRSSLTATDSLAKTASKIGTTTEALSALRYAADITGVATTTMDMALQRFTRRAAEAAKGTGEAKGAIRELGINAKVLNNMPLDQRMLVLADAFSKVENESDRLRLAFKLFDSEGAALVNTLGLGRDGLKDLLGEAKTLGLVMSSDAAEGVEDANDAITRLKALFKGIRDQIVAKLAPAIEGLATAFKDKLLTAIDNTKGGLDGFAKSLAIDFIDGAMTTVTAAQNIGNAVIGMYNAMIAGKAKWDSLFGNSSSFDALAKDLEIVNDMLAGDLSRWRAQSAIATGDWDNFFPKKWSTGDLLEKKDELTAAIADLVSKGQGTSEIPLINLDGLLAMLASARTTVDEFVPAIEGVIAPLEALDEKAKTSTIAIGAMKQAFEDWKKALPTVEEGMTSLTNNAMNAFTKGFTDAITGAEKFSDAMKIMAKSVIDSLIEMLVQYYITQAIFGAITNAFPSGGGGGGGGSSGAPNSYSPSFAGGGFTGMGSRSGGVDGKGGFPAILHPNETVIDHTKGGGGGGGVVVNQTINVTTGIQSTVRAEIVQLMPQIAQAAKGAVADARLRGGNFSKAMGGA